ncbi:MAG TPA: hypothetical protein VGK09_08385 [Rhodocyclaceae bacterium]|jgi:hypothetical protein
MLFRLALALGRTVSELSAPGVLSHAEFVQWCQFYNQEPWGKYQDDLRTGVIASTVANVHSLFATGEAKWRPSDFMPKVEEPEPQQQEVEERTLTDDELAAWADAAIYGIAPDSQ